MKLLALRNKEGRWSLVLLSIVVALLLTVIPYPKWMHYASPDWVTLVLFYWCLALPKRMGVTTGWLCGLVLDILNFSLLGQHALGKALVALIANIAHLRLRMYHIWQQCFVVFLVVFMDRSLVLLIEHMSNDVLFEAKYWLSVLTTTLLWPFVYIILRAVRHKGHIA